VDGYVFEHLAHGPLTVISEVVARPHTDRPVPASGIETVELAEGLIVRQPAPPRVHHLNNTASVVLALCDGRRTVTQVAEVLAESFGLEGLPLAEVSACVGELRRAGVLLDRSTLPEQDRLATVDRQRPEDGR
jgi:hypothetical protein